MDQFIWANGMMVPNKERVGFMSQMVQHIKEIGSLAKSLEKESFFITESYSLRVTLSVVLKMDWEKNIFKMVIIIKVSTLIINLTAEVIIL